MSRNLGTSYCIECGYGPLKLDDLRGKPIEFRRYFSYVPALGCRWDCPRCNTAYFAIWSVTEEFWSRESLNNGQWKDPVYHLPDGSTYPNSTAGRFAVENTSSFGGVTQTTVHNTGCFTIDLSYYETYNDEPMDDGEDKDAIRRSEAHPWHLCADNADDAQLEWANKFRGEE